MIRLITACAGKLSQLHLHQNCIFESYLRFSASSSSASIHVSAGKCTALDQGKATRALSCQVM